MKKKWLKGEWRKLYHEIHHNKPKCEGPFPDEIIKAREWLIYAQVELDYIEASQNEEYNGPRKLDHKSGEVRYNLA